MITEDLMDYCASCGAQNSPSAKFCTGCGTRRQAGDATAYAPPVDPAQAVIDQTDAAAKAAHATLSSPQPQAGAQAYPPPASAPYAAPAGTAGQSAPAIGGAQMPAVDPGMLRMAGMGVAGLVALFIVVKIIGAVARSGFGSVLTIGALVLMAVVGYFAYTAHQQETREARTVASLPPSVQHVVAQMDPGAQTAFFNEYERYRKKTWVAYLLMWPLFGTHYFYLRQPLLNVLYWFTGAGAGIWGLIDVFRMRSLVRAANEQSARQALQTLHIGAVFGNMPAAPQAMAQPTPPMNTQPAAAPMPTVHPTPQDRV
ncbi:TM2 domain-containing protein [Mobilicoccus pelagius]|nr:TM2 domain-containing protein [Mobilicoccus pelagius]